MQFTLENHSLNSLALLFWTHIKIIFGWRKAEHIRLHKIHIRSRRDTWYMVYCLFAFSLTAHCVRRRDLRAECWPIADTAPLQGPFISQFVFFSLLCSIRIAVFSGVVALFWLIVSLYKSKTSYFFATASKFWFDCVLLNTFELLEFRMQTVYQLGFLHKPT